MQQRGTTFMAFSAQISRGNQAKIRTSIRQIVNWRDTTLELGHIAEKLNRKIRGWVNYFDRYGKSKLRQVLIYLDMKLVKWLKHKHKCGLRKAIQHLASYQRQTPQLFYHWIKKYCLNVNKLTRAV
jgi:RNA-directed DNA polymerase